MEYVSNEEWPEEQQRLRAWAEEGWLVAAVRGDHTRRVFTLREKAPGEENCWTELGQEGGSAAAIAYVLGGPDTGAPALVAGRRVVGAVGITDRYVRFYWIEDRDVGRAGDECGPWHYRVEIRPIDQDSPGTFHGWELVASIRRSCRHDGWGLDGGQVDHDTPCVMDIYASTTHVPPPTAPALKAPPMRRRWFRRR